jgi:hypothetical protein
VTADLSLHLADPLEGFHPAPRAGRPGRVVPDPGGVPVVVAQRPLGRGDEPPRNRLDVAVEGRLTLDRRPHRLSPPVHFRVCDYKPIVRPLYTAHPQPPQGLPAAPLPGRPPGRLVSRLRLFGVAGPVRAMSREPILRRRLRSIRALRSRCA